VTIMIKVDAEEEQQAKAGLREDDVDTTEKVKQNIDDDATKADKNIGGA